MISSLNTQSTYYEFVLGILQPKRNSTSFFTYLYNKRFVQCLLYIFTYSKRKSCHKIDACI